MIDQLLGDCTDFFDRYDDLVSEYSALSAVKLYIEYKRLNNSAHLSRTEEVEKAGRVYSIEHVLKYHTPNDKKNRLADFIQRYDGEGSRLFREEFIFFEKPSDDYRCHPSLR